VLREAAAGVRLALTTRRRARLVVCEHVYLSAKSARRSGRGHLGSGGWPQSRCQRRGI